MARTGALSRLAAMTLVLVACGCRASWGAAEDRSYEELQERLDADFAAADAAKAKTAALPEGTIREQRLAAWDEILQALLWAETAAGLAQLTTDAAALGRIEGQRTELAAVASALVAATELDPIR